MCYYLSMNRSDAMKTIRSKYVALSKVMDERVRRLWAAGEAKALGWGGISLVSMAIIPSLIECVLHDVIDKTKFSIVAIIAIVIIINRYRFL